MSDPRLDPAEARFRTLIERNADGQVVLDEQGSIAYVNPATETLLCRTSEELLGQPFGIPVVPGETTEVDIPCSTGEVRFAELRVVEIEWSGRPALLASLRDITARRRSEQALRESEERFRLLVEGVKDYGILMFDPAGGIVSWNSGAERLTGYAESEALGRHFRMLFTPEDVAAGAPEAEMRRAAEEGRSEDDRWHVRRDGSRYWASGVVTPVLDELGRLRGFAKVLRDMTERRRMEEELRHRNDELAEADRQKNDYLAMLAHELRNPLAPVLNAVQILRLPGVDPATAERARRMVEQQVGHMARLVDDLLDISRITRGKIQLRRRRVDLAALLRRAEESVRPMAEDREIALELDLPGDPLPIEADPTRIEQVLSNLLNNAVKYNEAGGHVRASAARDGQHVVVRIRDSGVGIDPEVLPRIFDLFVQADRSLDRSQGGLGIGLTLVRTLVERHGGSVAALSDGLGLGSEFVVRLPAAPALEVAETDPSPSARSATRPLRILVVDDNHHSAESLGVLLRHWGHEPKLAHDGPSAIESTLEHRPEIILLDIGLPRMDGYSVARRLRAEPDLARPVIIAMTGYGQEEDRRRALEAGFDHHLLKPLDLKGLRELLAELGDSDGRAKNHGHKID